MKVSVLQQSENDVSILDVQQSDKNVRISRATIGQQC